jgi:omega-6 fatty acid desaturase (delta-12 desaturase)
VLTLTPYDCWRRDHNHHHAGAGNLDRRGIGDVTTLTVNEYKALAPWAKFKYRLYRQYSSSSFSTAFLASPSGTAHLHG